MPGTIACQTLDFFIRFRSDVWPGQRDGRRLFRHAVPGCFPDLKGALARRDETASCPEPNENIKGLAGIVPGTQTKPQDTLQIRKTPWHGVTKQPPAVPLPGPNVTPEPNEKLKGLAGNYSRHTKQATRHPSNQENTLARRDETFQAHKTRAE